MKRRHDYSQHFLHDPNLVKELIGHSSIKKRDLVLDIGAGSGVISSALSSRARHVISIENESKTIGLLHKNLERFDNITILEVDALTYALPNESYKVFSNIPFHLSAALVRRLTLESQYSSDIYLIVQKQFATKLLIDISSFTGMIGAQITPWFDAKIRRLLKRTDFMPKPNVDTVLLHLHRRDTPYLELSRQDSYTKFVERCFHDQVYFAKLPLMQLFQRVQRPSELSAKQWNILFSRVMQ